MKTPSRFFALLCVFAFSLSLAGCVHVPSGGTKEAGVKFGITGLFMVTKTVNNVKVTPANIRWGDSLTTVQVGLFTWDSWAKDTILANPPAPKKEEPK